ncbi:cellulose-growth-specific protein [Coprinopsis sp. MPI-PUGE-AT-0042]|nr:cellulose-growth-specific protein [Coprinopsis sp. MPI-PUGE-AT-0042]
MSSHCSVTFTLLVSFVARGIQAHGGVQSYLINGVDYYKGFSAYIPPEEQITIARPWYSIDPLTACNNYGEAVPGGGQISAHVKAGDTIQANWGSYGSAVPGSALRPIVHSCYGSRSLMKLNSCEGLISGNLHELIALHPEWTGPQFYPECAQLIVSGGGGKLPPAKYLVTFPGGYKTEDPGLNVDLYDPRAVNITHYEIPGPLIWDGQQDYSGAL